MAYSKEKTQNAASREEREAAFITFDTKHPEVGKKLIALAHQAKATKRSSIGFPLLWEVCRWSYIIEKGDNEFTLNNNFRSFYARKIMLENPDLRGFFEIRKQSDEE